MPKTFPRLQKTALVLLGSGLLSGCDFHPPQLNIETTVRADSLLLSEILAADDRTRLVNCPIQVTNMAGEPQSVRLRDTGCSCYGVFHNQAELAKGESVAIPAETSDVLRIRAMPPDGPAEKEYFARFLIGDADRAEEVEVRCQLRVYDDLAVTPNTLTLVHLPPAASRITRYVDIENVYRADTGEQHAIEIVDLPEFAKLISIEPTGAVETLEKSLFKQNWRATIEFQIAAEATATDEPIVASVISRNVDGAVSAKSALRTIIHVPQAVIFPNRVHFGQIDVGESRKRRILISSPEGGSFRLSTDPRQTPSSLRVDLPDSANTEHWVELTLTPDSAGTIDELLVLKTDVPSQPRLKIHIAGLASDAKN